MKRMGLGVLVLVTVGALALGGGALWRPIYARLRPRRSTDEVLTRLGPSARARLEPRFAACAVAYPPERIALLGFKAERTLELWAHAGDTWRHVHTWPVLAMSGGPGPKLREGDRQVPEGCYRIAALNPNSQFHLSLQVDYPNAFDRARALAEARDPGGEIFIHGGERSIGCLAIGDEAIEELFTLVATIGLEHVEIVLAPNDLRGERAALDGAEPPTWRREQLGAIRAALVDFGARAAVR